MLNINFVLYILFFSYIVIDLFQLSLAEEFDVSPNVQIGTFIAKASCAIGGFVLFLVEVFS